MIITSYKGKEIQLDAKIVLRNKKTSQRLILFLSHSENISVTGHHVMLAKAIDLEKVMDRENWSCRLSLCHHPPTLNSSYAYFI